MNLATSDSRPAPSSKRKSFRALVAGAMAACVLIVPVAIVVRLPPPAAFEGVVAYRAITSGAWNDRSPVWSPDSLYLAFAATVGRYYHIFIVDTTNGIKPMPIGFWRVM